MPYVPVSASGSASVFRLEAQVVGRGHAPARNRCYELEYLRNGEKWLMNLWHYTDNDYALVVRAPGTVKAFTYTQYQRTNNSDIQFKNNYLDLGRRLGSFFVGAEISVARETPTGGTLSAASASPWNFTSSKQMQNWDVILRVGETKFYAHKQTLSLVSSTFDTMFNGDFREKNQQEMPVNVEGINADHFEAFLHCIYPFATEPKAEFIEEPVTLADYYNVEPLREKCLTMLKGLLNIPKLDKLRIALKVHSTAVEKEVIASFTKDDIRELLACHVKDQLNGISWQKVVAQSLAL